MAVKIIVDSTADLSANKSERFPKVPLRVRFGEQEYRDGVDITYREFYEKLIESDVLPTTSQATPGMFSEVLEREVGPEDTAVVIVVAGSLSGTYGSAVIAAQDYDGRVFVVDSETATIGAGILAEYGLELAEKGWSADRIAGELETAKKKIRIIALLDTLEYLKKGGRISKTVAFAGGVLNIKPVISLVAGEIKVLGKARGSKQGSNLLTEEIGKTGGVDFSKPVLLGYTGLTDVMLQKYVEDSKHIWEDSVEQLDAACIGSVIGTHVGPGAIAAAFFAL